MAKVLRMEAEACKSCGYCVKQCPTQALSISEQLNEAGYRYAEVDREKCVCCGMCYEVCPDYVFSIIEEEESKHE